MKKKKYSVLDHKKHGVGGLIKGALRERKQDKKAKSTEMYAVVFFPKIHGIGKANMGFFSIARSIANSPEAAIAKFMDEIKRGEKWETYHDAGHRVRRVKIMDMGDA